MPKTKLVWTESCRICLKTVVNGKYVSIGTSVDTEKTGNLKTYMELFEICTGYSILDNEPQELCKICLKDLLKVYQFRVRCEATQEVIKSKIEKFEMKSEYDKLDLDSFSTRPASSKLTIEAEVLGGHTIEDSNEICDTSHEEPDTNKKNKRNLNSERAKCEYCSASYKHRANLSTHYKVSHPDKKTSECSYCKKLFFTKSLQESHKKNCPERPDRNRICPVCGKQSNSNHIFYHTQKQTQRELTAEGIPKGSYICDLCGASVQTRYSMINHMKAQHFNEKLKCKHCEAEFRYPSYLTIHIQTIHEQKPIVYKCGKCGFIASTGSQLRKHRIIHSGKKPFICSVCAYECYIRLEFENHMASHSNLRPHSCGICGAAFKTKKTLRVHKTTHTGYDYECPVCQKSYLTNHLMRMHVEKIHPEYNLPPPGTVFSKTALKRIAEKEKKKIAMRDASVVKA